MIKLVMEFQTLSTKLRVSAQDVVTNTKDVFIAIQTTVYNAWMVITQIEVDASLVINQKVAKMENANKEDVPSVKMVTTRMTSNVLYAEIH